MRDIYRTSWECIQKNWMIYVIFAVMEQAAPLVIRISELARLGTELLLDTLLAYWIHRYFLFNEAFGTTWKWGTLERPSTWRRFMLVSVLVLAVHTVLAIWSATLFDSAEHADAMWLISFALTGGSYLMFLTIFGTALPAAAAGDRFGFGVTLSRASEAGWNMLCQLIAGPGLFSVSSFLAWSLMFTTLATSSYASVVDSAAFDFGATTVARLLGYFGTTLAIAVLCRGYRFATTG